MRWYWPFSIRGKLVLWYVAVLAILLAALGTFQWLTLSSYLRSSAALSLRHAAYQELGVLSPCYLRSSSDLRNNATTLARLLGGPFTAVTIVTPTGQALASHDLGPPGAGKPLHLSAATIRQLIGSNASKQSPTPERVPVSKCPTPRNDIADRHHHVGPELGTSLISGGRLILVAVPLGPHGRPLGYAILGRSLQSEDATLARMLLIFLLGAGAALLVASLIALPIINRALRPLRQVAGTAEAIAAGDVGKRAHLENSRDEVGRLGDAFDRMVDRLQAAISAATASEERMRRFLADASHELRTPVTVLRGTSQVLLRQGSGLRPEVLGALNDMHEEAVRLARLVDDLLMLSRLDAGQQLAPEHIELRPFLHEFLDRYGTAWPERTIHFDESRLDGAAAEVDPEALRRIVTNIIDNASRYSRPAGVITVAGEPGQQCVRLTIADEGPGLGPEDARRVFDRFYRAQKSRSRHSGGTGLGLAIVHGLVEQSGGSIDFDTALDRGTTVTVTLPRSQDVREPDAPSLATAAHCD